MGSNKGTTCHIEIKGENESRSEEIDLFPFVIGRGDEADIKILAPGISRSHICVSLRERSLWIEDLGSANGTFLNGKKLNPKTAVIYNVGDVVRVGLNNDILTFNLVEEKSVDQHVIVLPPLPLHNPVPVAKEPLFQNELAEASAAASTEHIEGAKAAALKIKISAEAEAAKILQSAKDMAHNEISKSKEEGAKIVSKATEQSYRLQREAESEVAKIRQSMQEAVSKANSETEDKIEKALAEARLSATAIKATAQTEADGIISKAYQKVLEIKNKGEEELKTLQREEKKKSGEIIEKAQKEADKILGEAHSASIKIRENIDKEIDSIKTRAEKEAEKENENLIKAAKLEAEKISKEALKAAKKISEEVLKSERASNLNNFEKENKNLAEAILTAQLSLKKLEEEKSRLHDSIEIYKDREAKMTKDFEENRAKLTKDYDELKAKLSRSNSEATAKLTKEHEDFKARLVTEREDLKNKMTSLLGEEEKSLKEKAKANFYLQREALEKEFTKSRVMEISKALEVYIIPRLKEGLNWKEIPKPLSNFSSDLRDIVTKVMTGDFSKMVADTAMDTSLNHKTSSKWAETFRYLSVGGGTAVLAFLAYAFFQNPATDSRKPASQIPAKIFKPSPPAVIPEDYKDTYTDNVLYTKGYVALRLNRNRHEIWKTEIDSFFTNNLGLKKSSADKFIDEEFQLIHQLAELKEEITAENRKEFVQKMDATEKLSVDQLVETLGGQENYNTFRGFEKNYIERNRLPASQN